MNSVTIKQSNSSTSNNSEKEVRKEKVEREERESRGRERERDRERESTEKNVTIKEKSSSKDSKRDKDDGGESRKRDRGEKRSDRSERKYYNPVSPIHLSYQNADGVASPYYTPTSPMYAPEPNDRFHPDAYDVGDRDRDLSSISNSSKGSNNRRSQDSPDDRDIKRRRVDGSKVRIRNIFFLPFILFIKKNLENTLTTHWFFFLFLQLSEK